MEPVKQKAVRTYVKVDTSFDTTGFMRPRSIIWQDGRVLKIKSVKDLCPVGRNERYTVVIRGEQRYPYFERPSELLPFRFGRWYVKCAV